MSFNATSNKYVNVIGKITVFVQLTNTQLPVHFGFADILSIPLLVGALFINRFVNGMFPLERGIFPVLSRPVVIISK